MVWVQTDRAGTVSVLGREARTFEVSGFHYALVTVDGLAPDSRTEYRVELDGEQVWPPRDYPYPTPVIRTRGRTGNQVRALFGSCRFPKAGDPALDARLGLDALDCYATRMVSRPEPEWPDALLLLGDQVYADELTPSARRLLAARRRNRALTKPRPPNEVISFAEYERLYRSSWSDPEIRWLMSTVPTAMIFDDHDIRDDWNTSAAWRARMARTPWWPDRIRAGLASYWVYQHLGNLTPDELATDPTFRSVSGAGNDTWPVLADFAERADREVNGAKGTRFSFRWDLGRARLIMLDTRNGRILEGPTRKLVGDDEFEWLTAQATEDPAGTDHLILGTSLPWLLPHVIHDLQAINERAAQRPGRRGRAAEWMRQAGDLEHWAAFGHSFHRLAELISRVAGGPDAPATVTVLSGDVHHSYAARAEVQSSATDTEIYQLVCSPVHNRVPAVIRPAFRLGWSRAPRAVTGWWARRCGAGPRGVRWTKPIGPLHGNTIATLRLDGRAAGVIFEQPTGPATLETVAEMDLTGQNVACATQ